MAGPPPSQPRFEGLELIEMFAAVEKFPDQEKAGVKKALGAFVTQRQVDELGGGPAGAATRDFRATDAAWIQAAQRNWMSSGGSC